jgi:hypothetical protein
MSAAHAQEREATSSAHTSSWPDRARRDPPGKMYEAGQYLYIVGRGPRSHAHARPSPSPFYPLPFCLSTSSLSISLVFCARRITMMQEAFLGGARVPIQQGIRAPANVYIPRRRRKLPVCVCRSMPQSTEGSPSWKRHART